MEKPAITQRSLETLSGFGKILKEQRTILTKESIEDFSSKISQTFQLEVTAKDIESMENGSGDVPVLFWICIWTYFQNIDHIKKSYNPKEMLYLAQQEFLSNIEKNLHNK